MFSDCLPVCVCFHACMLMQSHSVTNLPLTCACLFLACTGCVSVAEWRWLWRRSRWRCTKTKAKTSSQLLSLAQELLSLMGKSSLMICHLSACLSFISNKAYIHCNMVHILVTDCCILATVIMIVTAAAATTAVWHYNWVILPPLFIMSAAVTVTYRMIRKTYLLTKYLKTSGIGAVHLSGCK